MLIRRNDSNKLEAYLEEIPGPGLCLNVRGPQGGVWFFPDGLGERQPPPLPPAPLFPLLPPLQVSSSEQNILCMLFFDILYRCKVYLRILLNRDK